MGINFNIVKKPKNDEEEIEEKDELEEEKDELEDDEEDNKKSFGAYDPKKKMFRFMGMIIGIMILLLLILFIVSLGKNKSNAYSYSEIESILEKAGKSYFKAHPDYLPTDDESIIEVDSSNLASEGYMKELSSYTKKNVSCTGSVSAQLEGDGYLYTPNLNCGDSYSTVSFADKILSDSDVVTSGYGLYSNNGSYVFRGENINNYVKLDKSLWRIVKITSNDNVVLVSEEGAGFTRPWDDRYNEEALYEAGINNYRTSRVKDYLGKVYSKPSKDEQEDILSKKDKNRLVEFDLCIGKSTLNNENKNNSSECKDILQDQKLGLLTLSDYLYASVDPNCKSASTKSCKNYNYLVIKNDWWLVTANSNDTATVFEVGSNGVVTEDFASNYALVRPVIYLNSNVMYKSGKGTLEKPYKVR